MKKIMLAIAVAILGGLAAVKGDEPASRPSNTMKAFRAVRIDAPNVYLDVVQEFEKDYSSAIRAGAGSGSGHRHRARARLTMRRNC